MQTMKLNHRHGKAAFNHTVNIPVTTAMYSQLENAGLAEKRGSEWALTERGCDLAAGRFTIKRGQLVKA